jgi:hypothetical protein
VESGGARPKNLLSVTTYSLTTLKIPQTRAEREEL